MMVLVFLIYWEEKQATGKRQISGKREIDGGEQSAILRIRGEPLRVNYFPSGLQVQRSSFIFFADCENTVCLFQIYFSRAKSSRTLFLMIAKNGLFCTCDDKLTVRIIWREWDFLASDNQHGRIFSPGSGLYPEVSDLEQNALSPLGKIN
jgi:hypothetical protein